MHKQVITSVIQPPSRIFIVSMTIKMERQSTKPMACTLRCWTHFLSVLRSRTQNRTMPNSESENVAKTLMLYMTTRI